MKYNLLKDNSHHFTTYRVTSHLNTMSHTFSHHSCTQESKHDITQPINIDQYTSIMQQIY